MTAIDLMRQAGWAQYRKVPVGDHLAALREGGFHTWDGLASVLEQISSLEICDAAGGRTLWFDPARAAALADIDWVTDYERAAGVPLAPVGLQSHMLVMVGSDSAFYGGFDNLFGRLGANLEEVVDGMLVAEAPHRLAITIE